MIFGILPFLIQWIALSQVGKLSNYEYSRSYNTIVPSPTTHPPNYPSTSPDYIHSSLPPKSHWTLLSDLQQLREDEIEIFLPQICNMILDQSSLSDPRIIDYFEQMLIQKCSECLPFGIRVTNMLRALLVSDSSSSSGSTQYNLFQQMLNSRSSTNNANSLNRETRIRKLLERIESMTAKGNPNLPVMVSELRAEYYRDFQFLLDTFARLGVELKTYPVHQRNFHLRRALSQCNALFYYRMLTQKSITELSNEEILSFYHHYDHLQVESIAQYCPAAACFSLHLPLQHASEKCLRILRIIEQESELLPSKERCPYQVVVELLEQPFPCTSDELYTEGRKLCLQTTDDLLQHRGINYQNPQMMPTLTQYDHHYYSHQHFSHKNRKSLPSLPISSLSRFRSKRRLLPSISNMERGVRKEDIMEEEIESSVKPNTEEIYEFITHPDSIRSKIDELEKSNEEHRRPKQEGEEEEEEEGLESCDDDKILDLNEDQQQYVDEVMKTQEFLRYTKGSSASSSLSSRSSPYKGLFARDGSNVIDSSQNQTSFSTSHSRSDMRSATRRELRGGASTTSSSPYYPPTHPSSSSLPTSSSQDYQPLSYYGSSSRESHQPQDPYRSPPPPSSQSLYSSPSQYDAYSSPPYHPSTSPPDYHHRTLVRTKTWEEKKALIRSLSPFGHLEGWNLASFIVKSGDDLRKEVLAMQLIEYLQQIFQYEQLDLFLKPYQILVTGPKAGLIEYLEGTMSIDRIKKYYVRSGSSTGQGPNPIDPNIPTMTVPASAASHHRSNPHIMSLQEYFTLHFGERYSPLYHKAIVNFVKSLAGYSLVTYLLQVKDRHNANILIDSEGHMIHIDFGFILGESPGFNLNFESAPFKLTQEYLDLLTGGQSSSNPGGLIDNPMFQLFEELFVKGFLAIQKHYDGLAAIIQLFYEDDKKAQEILELLKSRLFFPKNPLEIKKLIYESMDNFRTKSYDWYQQRTNNIFM